MKILVIHAHNDNRGDEAAVKAMVDELIVKYPNCSITISINGATFYPNMPSNVKQIPRFPILHSKIAQAEFMLTIATKGNFAFTKDARCFLKAVREADIVLHAPGGPSIGDTYFDAERLYLWRLKLIKEMGKKYIFYAPSMGPFHNDERKLLRKEVIENAKGVIVRDPISFDYLKKFLPDINVIQALDSALQHDIDYIENEKKLRRYSSLQKFLENHGKCIGITITDLSWHPVHKTKAYTKKIKSVFDAFISNCEDKGYGILFIPQLYGKHDDTTSMKEFMHGDNSFIIESNSDTYDSYFQQYIISKLYAVIGMRYHSNIFSAKMGTPFVAISYEQKTKGFMKAIGLSDYCIDIQNISLEELEGKMRLVEESYDYLKEQLIDIHDTIKKQSYISTQYVIDVLEEKK